MGSMVEEAIDERRVLRSMDVGLRCGRFVDMLGIVGEKEKAFVILAIVFEVLHGVFVVDLVCCYCQDSVSQMVACTVMALCDGINSCIWLRIASKY